MIGLFEKFWSNILQRRIIRETNQYAFEVLEGTANKTRRDLGWIPLGLQEFRAYIGMCLLMGVKKLPSTRLYWSRREALFHCSVISQVMTRERYELITRCLHVANAPADVMDRDSATYDKLHKVRWMVDEVTNYFKAMWTPNQQLTVDECMVMYKGQYCPIRQYMPNKHVRFGIQVWAAADALSKHLWNFKIYCGKGGNPHDVDSDTDDDSDSGSSSDPEVLHSGKGEGLQGRNVVKTLLKDLVGRGHIVTTDNFFTSVPLFLDLLDSGIMATGTLRADRKYVPRAMFAKSITKKQDLGWVDYRMHEERKLCCMVWKDKQAVRLLSTHAEPISQPGKREFVRQKVGVGKKEN
jgi:hypothetical protein